MYISEIELRDWKAYSAATFQFPAPSEKKNIILIGALNGYGKTSLLEAIILGMFGRNGLPLIARSSLSGSNGKDRLTVSYKDFLKRVLHQGALQNGRTSCSVKLSFIMDQGEPLEINRIWHFDDSGDFIPEDEQVLIFEGLERRAVGPGALSENERTDWFLEYIAEKLIPFTLAHFFMFDGEQVSVLAEKEMSSQVRAGIEGLLGIPIFRQLADDLRKYADARRKETHGANISQGEINALEAETESLQSESDRIEARLDVIEPEQVELRKEQRNLIHDLSFFGNGSQADFQEKFEKMKEYERAIERDESEVEYLLGHDLALSLTGKALRRRVKAQLEGEIAYEKWEAGKYQSDVNRKKFVESLASKINKSKIASTKKARDEIVKIAGNVWKNVWEKQPKGCLEDHLHDYLTPVEKQAAIDRIEEVNKLNAVEISNLLHSISVHNEALIDLQEDVKRIEKMAPDVDKMRLRLSEIGTQIQNNDQEIGKLKSEFMALGAQLLKKSGELSKHVGESNDTEPTIRRATHANKIALMIDQIVEAAVPTQINTIAEAMTTAHRSMALKKDLVKNIIIDAECNVQLLNAQGVDLRDYDLSAGEKQIFTQSLISAISLVSGCGFPMIVDAPLGRLDTEHRKGLLNHLVSRDHQVILLSTNTEVVGEYLDEIAPHIQEKYLVDFVKSGNIGESSVRKGYFEERTRV